MPEATTTATTASTPEDNSDSRFRATAVGGTQMTSPIEEPIKPSEGGEHASPALSWASGVDVPGDEATSAAAAVLRWVQELDAEERLHLDNEEDAEVEDTLER